ncbi:MAG TPA: tetratricopeptide repeat protein [Thermoanaerobaculia bacterium]|nr:tetratricopeptide repeat protein [Thermoanaerobaculia bacterium]
MHRPWLYVMAMMALASCARQQAAPAPENPEPAFVGRQTCATCHAEEDRLWQGSHHDLAMQEATEATVLGDFGGATLTHFGTTSTFFRRDGRFFVRTDGPDGKLHDFPIAYTFGVSPLQQYLVEMPGGRLQTLPLCWDTEGRRWFHLYSEPVPAGDALHWTGPNQTWNYMCAECHSTGVRKGYDAGKNVYETSWSEIDVSCEACHGPGLQHVKDGKSFDVRLKDPGRGTWIADPAAGMGRRLAPRVATDEVETCGRCHASRSPIQESQGSVLLDSHRPTLLEAGSYHADGQIDGEVYEYGSFLQSRMYHEGVTCSDCHEPHSQTLRRTGNALCTHCHSAPKLDTPEHHKHKEIQCVDCHMPEKTYMGVDRRRDHSLRVPRPDLTVKIGSPNACNGCHSDRSAKWAAATVERWYGARDPHWGEAIHAGRTGQPGAEPALAAVASDPEVPAIARATALSLLRSEPSLAIGLQDPDPLVRLGAILGTGSLEPEARLRLTSPLLIDPVRGVRIEAARILNGNNAPGLEPALAEYRSAQEANADRPEAHLNLGWLDALRNDFASAEASYRNALRLDPGFAPAYVNLADLFRLQGRDAEGEALLRQAPDEAGVHHSLGLLLVRLGRLDEALPELARAVELAPGEARYAYVYEVALSERKPR